MDIPRLLPALATPGASLAADGTPNPSWWNKYQYLLQHGPSPFAPGAALSVGANVDVSNECGPQSETFIALDSSHPSVLAGGSNEIFRLPMRGDFSSDDGASWGGVDLPLPPAPAGTHDTRLRSDPSLAFDTLGKLFYSYIFVFFGG